MRAPPQWMRSGFTLVELVIVLVLSGLLFVTTPILVFHGVKTLVYLPKALAVNEAATEALHQMVESGFSTLSGQTTLQGLRFAVRRSATEPALWLVEANRVGFRTAGGQLVQIRLDGTVVRRGLAATASCPASNPVIEEVLPYQAPVMNVQINAAGSLFLYYDINGAPVAPLASGCPPATAIRRVDIACAAQTGNGLFDEGNAREDITTSVAIRIP